MLAQAVQAGDFLGIMDEAAENISFLFLLGSLDGFLDAEAKAGGAGDGDFAGHALA
jgi:hypothetical protein